MGEGTARRVSRRRFLKTAFALGAGTTTMGIGGGLYSVGIEPFGVEVTRIRLRLPRLAAAFSGYRLVQISDIPPGRHGDDTCAAARYRCAGECPAGGCHLQLSEHSHGGQVNLPLFGRPRLPRLGRKYPAGLYQVQSMQLYTNRGLGVVWPRVRFNCRPELTVFTLESV